MERPYQLALGVIALDFHQAQEVAQRLINSHFRQEPQARMRIPASPTDDDLFISDFLEACQEQIAALRAERDALRPAVRAFAMLMEAKLREKDAAGYPDWRKETPLQHLFAIMDEWQETNIEMGANDGDGSRDAEARGKATDIALRAMMLTDRLSQLCAHDGRGRAVQEA